MQCKRAAGHPVATECDEAFAVDTSVHTPVHIASVTSRSRSAPEDDRLEHENSEAGLRESEQLLCTTIERAVVGIAHASLEGRWLRYNQQLCDLLGYTREELGTRTFQDVTYPDDLDASLVVLQRLLAGELDAYEWDKRYVRKDGTLIWVHLTVTLVRSVAGVPNYCMTIVQDITERKRLEQEQAHLLEQERAARRVAEAARANELASQEASRQMEAFLAVAAHDLRTPLTATVGFLDLASLQTDRLAEAVAAMRDVREAYPELVERVEAVRSRLEDASQGAERLARLLARLFDLAAIRADRLELSRAQCDLATLVSEQVAAQRVAAPSRTIRLHTPTASVGGEPGSVIPVVPVEADADRIGQVVANYLTNALKYAPADLPVDVSVEMVVTTAGEGQVARLARVAVRDRGQGLPEAEQVQVWERFHWAPGIAVQCGAPSGAAGGGLGLGLYICKAIVEAHGGQVGVESMVGEGSTFWFTLPLSLSGPRAGATGTSAAP